MKWNHTFAFVPRFFNSTPKNYQFSIYRNWQPITFLLWCNIWALLHKGTPVVPETIVQGKSVLIFIRLVGPRLWVNPFIGGKSEMIQKLVVRWSNGSGTWFSTKISLDFLEFAGKVQKYLDCLDDGIILTSVVLSVFHAIQINIFESEKTFASNPWLDKTN